MIYGVDVSHHNGSVNWAALRATGKCQFAVIRISHGVTMDRKFATNLAACKAQKTPYAFYVYAEANTVAGAQAEARLALSKISGTSPLFVAYDAESAALAAKAKNQTTDIANAFLTLVKAAGFTPYVYTNESWRLNEIDIQFLKNKGYGFWYARYTGQTPPAASYQSMCDIWQYSSTGKLSGNGSQYIDLNVCYNADLIAKAAGGAPDPNYIDTTTFKTSVGKIYQFKSGSPLNVAYGDRYLKRIAETRDGAGWYYTKYQAVARGVVGVYMKGARRCVVTIQ